MFTKETARLGGLKSKRSKSIDISLIEKLTPLDDIAFEKLKQGIERGDFQYLKLYFSYKYGRPKAIKEVTINAETPLFNL
ncbi:hypothetical protein N8Z72_00475 [Polaribacter sp.]|nr:hypothetical protein [Polaribacter sp.]